MRRRGWKPATSSEAELTLDLGPEVDPGTVVAQLEAWSAPPSARVAARLRDYAAGFYLRDPSQADLLARALARVADRAGEALSAAAAAHIWRCRAEAFLFVGHHRDALQAYRRATDAARHARAGDLVGQILVGRVHLLSLLGEARDAARLAAEAERRLRRSGNLVYLGKLFMNRGNAAYQREAYAEAHTAYRRADRIFTQAGIKDATAVGLLMNLAIACTNLGRLDEARSTFRRARSACAALGLEALDAHVHYNEAFLDLLAGDYRAALGRLEEAGETFARQGIEDMRAATDRARAEIYLELGMPREATELATRATAAFEREGMDLDAALGRLLAARGLAASDDLGAAGALLLEVEVFLRRRRHATRHAQVLVERARLAVRCGEPGEGGRLAGRAARTLRSRGVPQQADEALRIRAAAALARGRFAAAERILQPILRRATRYPAGTRARVWSLAGQVAAARQKRSRAVERLRRAVRAVEEQRVQIPGAELRARAFEEHAAIYHELFALERNAPRPNLETLFQLTEAARARGFREREAGPGQKLRRRLAGKRAQLGARVKQLEEAEFPAEGAPDPATIAGLQREVRQGEREIADLLRRGEGRAKGGSPWQSRLAIEDVQRLLRRDEVLIDYFVAGERVNAFVIDRGRHSMHVLPEAVPAVRERIERVRFQIDTMVLETSSALDRDPTFLRRSAEAALCALWEALLEPLASRLPEAGRLLVVPHRWLHAVPFECLWDGTAYLDERFELIRCPTADALLRRRRRHRRHGRVVLCGTVRAGTPAVAHELQTIADAFTAGDAILLEDCATERLLVEMERCRLLHLSAHGVFREDNPFFSRIGTGDGALFLADLLGRRTTAELVVLSACNSGRTFSGAGDDLSGVAHAFLAAGAARLVASLWRVQDEATRDWMGSFYRHIVQGRLAPAAAARAAQRETRAHWNHPFYWGSFSVHGS